MMMLITSLLVSVLVVPLLVLGEDGGHQSAPTYGVSITSPLNGQQLNETHGAITFTFALYGWGHAQRYEKEETSHNCSSIHLGALALTG